MTTIATLFSGGECVGVGARAAGLAHLWGVEYDDRIANVARQNGFHVITSDVMDIDPHTLPIPDVLHASPVCKRASVANQSAELNEDGTKEAPEDIATGQKVAQFIDVMTPQIVTIENVYAYRHFKAFKTITAALDRNGYFWDYDNLNAADYGVPQTRRRLVLRAKRGALLPMLLQPERWVGWYEAIEDLIPGLPDSQFAAWQLARLPDEINRMFMVQSGNSSRDMTFHEVNEPVATVTATSPKEPRRAFILDYQNGAQAGGVTLPQGDAPMFTVTNGKDGRQPVRAWLVDGDGNRSRTPTLLNDSEPSMTVQAWHGRRPIQAPRAWLSQGRVVRMTPRALARFQSLPDSYILPDSSKLACTIIGNGVPSLLYQKIIAALI